MTDAYPTLSHDSPLRAAIARAAELEAIASECDLCDERTSNGPTLIGGLAVVACADCRGEHR